MDVIKKVIEANDIHNGYSVSYVTKNGSKEVKPPRNVYGISLSGIVDKLDTRLDDVDYYRT